MNAHDYVVFGDTDAAGNFAADVALGDDGGIGLVHTEPARLRFYRIAGRSACGELGPK